MKKLLSVLLIACLCCFTVIGVSAIELDMVETAAELAPASSAEAEFEAVLAATTAPGINALTGTKQPATFEDGAIPAIISATAGFDKTVEDRTFGEDITKALKLLSTNTDGSEHYPNMSFNFPLESGRPVYFYADVCMEGTNTAHDRPFWLMNSGKVLASFHDTSPAGFVSNLNSGKWAVLSGTAYPTLNCNSVYLQLKIKGASVDNRVAFYFDNVQLIPYYKINYYGAATDYILFDSNNQLLESFVPNMEYVPVPDEGSTATVFLGWSTQQNASTPMTEVTLSGTDVNLYPVWAEPEIINLDNAWILGAITEGNVYNTATFMPKAGLTIDTWSVDVGNTRATYTINEDGTLTVTAAGYPGIVTVTASSAESLAKKTLRITGGDEGNFLPGVDIFSGTSDGLTLDDYTAEELSTVINLNNETEFKVDVNGNRYIHLTYRESTSTDTYSTVVFNRYPLNVIGDRPLYLAGKSYGDHDSGLFMKNIIGPSNKARDIRNNIPASGSWTDFGFEITEKFEQNNIRIQAGYKTNGNKTPFNLDNVSLTPYYMVTYHNGAGEIVHVEYVSPAESIYVPKTDVISDVVYSTTLGGQPVPQVSLVPGNDVNLYAVEGQYVYFFDGQNYAAGNLTGAQSYTIPTPEELGLNIQNFRYWILDGNYVFPGTSYDASDILERTLKAVCFKEKLFDPMLGDLIFFHDYEGTTSTSQFTYMNLEYNPEKVLGTRTDGTNPIAFGKEESGNTYVRLTSKGGVMLYGYGIPRNPKTEGGKATIKYDWLWETESLDAFNAIKGNANCDMLRIPNGDNGTIGDGHYSIGPMKRPDVVFGNVWYTAFEQRIDTDNLGLKGGILQHVGLSTSAPVSKRIDNFAFYVYPKGCFALYTDTTSDECIRVEAEGDTYIFEANNIQGIVAWTDGTTLYGIGKEYPVSELQFKQFRPFIQDASQPAVIFNYEGDRMLSTGLGSDNTYVELINDEGRTVVHLHSWDKKANRDKRIHFKAEKYDPKEYSILQVMTKSDNITRVADNELGYEPELEDHYIAAYFHYNGNGGYYNPSNPRVLYQKDHHGIKPGDGYVLMEIDTRTITNLVEGYELGYGVSLDLANGGSTRWGHDIYLDYVRMYRNGPFTVTYDTNAPAGATVIKNVAPDKNRGLGTGYLLNGDRPKVEGYTFKGWTLDPNATEVVLIDSFDMVGDTTVYAVWEANADIKVPDVEETVEIKGTGATNGIRFKSKILPSVKANLEEIGFIATRKALLPVINGAVNADALTFLLKKGGKNVNAYVTGVAYDKDGGIDIVNSEDADGNVIYTAVMTGIPLANKTETMYMRAYNKANIGGKEIVTYGPVSQISLYDVALAIKTAGGEAYESNKAYIDSILAE